MEFMRSTDEGAPGMGGITGMPEGAVGGPASALAALPAGGGRGGIIVAVVGDAMDAFGTLCGGGTLCPKVPAVVLPNGLKRSDARSKARGGVKTAAARFLRRLACLVACDLTYSPST